MDQLATGGDPIVRAAAQAYRDYYRHPYKEPHISGNDLQEGSVHRPNHGLAHALRKALLLPYVVEALNMTLTHELKRAMQITLIFQVTGRESEVGFHSRVG